MFTHRGKHTTHLGPHSKVADKESKSMGPGLCFYWSQGGRPGVTLCIAVFKTYEWEFKMQEEKNEQSTGSLPKSRSVKLRRLHEGGGRGEGGGGRRDGAWLSI